MTANFTVFLLYRVIITIKTIIIIITSTIKSIIITTTLVVYLLVHSKLSGRRAATNSPAQGKP